MLLENDECNRDEAMAEILRLTGDPSYTQQPSLFRASDPLYKNNQGYHGTTTAYGWKRLYNYDDYFKLGCLIVEKHDKHKEPFTIRIYMDDLIIFQYIMQR